MAEKTVSERLRETAQALAHAEEGEREMLEMLCTAQERQLRRALRAGISAEDCAEEFACAGGMLAAAALTAARESGEELSSLRAGGVTMTRKESTARIRALRENARALMAPYAKEGGFWFCRTER